ncbi:NADH-quinone oxidoreductase subunit K [candidate division KSB1 bacterium]|nr:NADH-quinone oxidoreductase subunit K [candidate division KSB1 bacterium]
MTEHTLITLTLAILIASIAAVEIRNLRTTSLAYLVHSIFLCAIIAGYAYVGKNESLYLWAMTCFLTKVVIIPYMLLRFVRRVPIHEHRPIIGFAGSIVIVTSLMVIFFSLFRKIIILLAPTTAAMEEPVRSLLAGAFSIFCLGLWALLTRRDVLKTVIGVALLENGVHLVLLALAPQLKETTMIGILTNVVANVFLLLYLSSHIYQIFGTMDSAKLSELKR